MSAKLARKITDEAMHRLDRGEAIVVPMPSPLAYCVVATTPEAINEAKGRPRNQEVASWILDANQILDDVEVDPREAKLLPWLLHDEGLTVLLSPRDDQPIPCHWRPSYRDGRVLLFGIRWRHLEGWMTTCKRPLYVSSANRTGMPSAVTASEVRAQMPSGIFIVDGDELRDPERKHGSTTMVLFGNGALQVVRHGVHDEAFEATQEWVADLLVRASDCVRAGECVRS